MTPKEVLREVNDENQTSPTYQKKEQGRRRLSVTDVDGNGIEDTEDNRGLIGELRIKSLLDFCQPSIPTNRRGNRSGRRFSVGSSTDHDMHRRGSYCEKSQFSQGHPFKSAEHKLGFACKKGLKPVSPNQDSFLVLRIEGHVSIYGVFDGHGRQGHDVSNFVKDFLPKLIVKDPAFLAGDIRTALLNGFRQTQELLELETLNKRLDASASGTTCTVAVHSGLKLWVANVGDSRCVIARNGDAIDACRDHKPDIPEERERICQNGGVVIKPPLDVNHRVYVKGFRFPGLAMSRALGDLIGYHRAGISAIPEIHEIDLDGSESMLMCSDGVWEFLSSQDAVNLISNYLVDLEEEDDEASQHMHAAELLCKVSWDKWMTEENGAVVDDITAIVAYLGSPSVMTVTSPDKTTSSSSGEDQSSRGSTPRSTRSARRTKRGIY